MREFISELQEFERAITDTRRPGPEMKAEYFDFLQKEIEQKSGRLFVIRANAEPIGFASCWIEHEDNPTHTTESNVYGFISDAYIVPEYRGKGIFERVDQKIHEYFSSFSEIRHVRLYVLAENRFAIQAYKKSGYDPQEITFVKKLDRKA